MSNPDPFSDIFPDVLENSLAEIGDLIGQNLTLQDAGSRQGKPDEVFASPRQKFVLAALAVKNSEADPVWLYFDLDLGIELAGRLVMLPAEEIASHKKKKEMDGELLDAFSEIVNILSGVVNSVFQEAFPGRKIHFVKGKLEIFQPRSTDLPFPPGNLTAFSGNVSAKESNLGAFTYFFPHTLMSGDEAGDAQGEAAENPAATNPAVTEPADPVPPVEPAGGEGDPEIFFDPIPLEPIPLEMDDGAEAAYVDQAFVETFLKEGLETACDELEALIGYKLVFVESQVLSKNKSEFVSRKRGKQVLTRITISGEREGQGYMLLPLGDAIHFGALLLMIPPESISEIAKKGAFDGDVADSYGEIANILVGTYSNLFKNDYPIKMSMKKGGVEVMEPSRGGASGEHPLPDGDYCVLSARIQAGEQTHGPIAFLFPFEILGLPQPSAFQAEAVPGVPEGNLEAFDLPVGQKNVHEGNACQNVDLETRKDERQTVSRIITILGEDSGELDKVEKEIQEAGFQYRRLSLDEDFRGGLAGEDTTCVILLISKVNDQGLARAIKIKSVMGKSCPLVLAGPEWTRSAVIKARRYGADDILVTPADKDSILRKCQKYT